MCYRLRGYQTKQTPTGDLRPAALYTVRPREYLLEKWCSSLRLQRFVETGRISPLLSSLCKPEKERRSLEMPQKFSVVEAVCKSHFLCSRYGGCGRQQIDVVVKPAIANYRHVPGVITMNQDETTK